MTVRLYYEDSYLMDFDATVLKTSAHGGKHAVVLDRTAFYPASGGQPHDTGALGSARVLAVEEDEDGFITHFADAQIPPGPVSGRVDRERRFDHMQQHTGQHILSQAFLRTAQAPTVSFHLGEETCTIDIDLAQPSTSLMSETEVLASGIVFEDRPVRVLNVDRSELAALGVRKESLREGVIRVIDVEGFDRSPCGGTHVRRTGEVGVISVLDFERYKGGTRVEFACGARALGALRRDREVLKTLGKLHSAHPSELPRLLEKLLEEKAGLARENSRLTDRIFELEAAELAGLAERKGGIGFVKQRYSDRTIDGVKLLAQKVAAFPSAVAILGLVQNGAQVVVARSADVSGSCGEAVRQAAAQFGGKGGGRPEFAQAGGIAESSLDAWIDSLEQYFLRLPG